MASLDTLIQDLVIANRILAKEDVVDAYGHVSVRHPDNPKHFFISRSPAPELLAKTDPVELGLDGQPVLGGEIRYISQGEIDARNAGYSPYATETWRAWEYWANKAACGHMLTRPDGGQVHKK